MSLPASKTSTDQLASHLAGQVFDLEREIMALAVAAPSSVAGAFAYADLLIGDLADDASRCVVAAAAAIRKPDAERIIRLALAELARKRIPCNRADVTDRALSFCTDCIARNQHCQQATDRLFTVVPILADLKRRLWDAADAYQFARQRLEGVAA